MTIASETSKVQYNGDGVTTDFAVSFKYAAKAQVVAIHADSDGVETTWVLGTQYTLTDPGASGTLTVETTPTDYTPLAGETLTIRRAVSILQSSDYITGGGLTAEGIEADLDARVFEAQMLAERLGRAPKLKDTTGSAAPTFPEPEASKAIAWNAAGDNLVNVDSPSVSVIDAAASAAAALASETAAASSASSASASAGDAASSATDAQTAEDNAVAAQAAAEAAQAAAEAASENPAFTFAFDDATADADPGAGLFRFDNASPGSAVTIFIDNSDGGGNDVTGWIDAFDDSTNTNKGILTIKGITSPTAFLVATVSGSVVDGSGYRKVTIAVLASGGTFTATEEFSVLFAATGDAGDVTLALLASTSNGEGASLVGIEDAGGLFSAGNVETALAETAGALNVAEAAISTNDGRLDAIEADYLDSSDSVVGPHTIVIPAGAMIAAATSGAASAQIEESSNAQTYNVLDFDAAADEYAHFNIAMPKSWDEGTVTYRVFWSSTATDTDGVAWGLQGVALSDNEAIDASWGTAVVVTDDAQGATNEVYVTSISTAVTIAGTPAEGDLCFFRVFRDVSDANDDMTEDARLIAIQIFYTINSATDA